MTLVNFKTVEIELTNFIRSLTKDPRTSRFTTTSQTFTATASQTAFVLTKYASCINSVTVNSVAQSYGIDYSYNIATKTVTLTVGATEGHSVVVSHDYVGTGATFSTIEGAWFFWGYPDVELDKEDYPRGGAEWLGSDSQVIDMSGSNLLSNPVFRLWVYSNDENGMVGKDTVKSTLAELRSDLFSKTDWYLDGKGQLRIIPLNMPESPKLDERRGRRVWGGFIDVELPLMTESKV